MKTKRKKLTNFLKLGILFFGISLLLWNCKEEETFQEELTQVKQNISFGYRVTTLEKIPKIIPTIENIKKIKKQENSVFARDLSFLNDIENLNTQEVIAYTDEAGYSTYNFKFHNNQQTINFENLHLLERKNGGYIGYILSYEPEKEWYYNHLNTEGKLIFNISDYQGEITKYSLEREIIWSTKSSNNYQARGGLDLVTVCVISYTPPECTVHPINGSWVGCPTGGIGSSSTSCTSVWAGGGTSGTNGDDGSDNNNGNGGNGGNGNTNEDCNDTSGTAITPDNNAGEGVASDCTPNNNNGTSATASSYTNFWQGLSYDQQDYLTLYPLFKGKIINYLNGNQYGPKAERHTIDIIDAGLDGTLITSFPFVKYPVGSNYATLYPKLTEYLKYQLPIIKDNQAIISKIVKYGDLSASIVKEHLEWGKGPEIVINQLGVNLGLFNGNYPNTLNLDIDLINELENTTPNSKLADAFAFLVGVTVLHEYVHYSEYTDLSWNNPESGELFEIDTYGQIVYRRNASIILKRK